MDINYNINLTVVLSVISICIAGLIGATKIFTRKPDEYPGKSSHCEKQNENIKRIETSECELLKENKILNEAINKIEKELAIFKIKMENKDNTIEDIKENTKEITKRLNDVIDQLLHLTNNLD